MTNRHMHIALVTLLLATLPAGAAELARFEIAEPLGQTWHGEWLTREVTLDLGDRQAVAGTLALLGLEGKAHPAQFYRDGKLLGADVKLLGKVKLEVLFRATIHAKKTHAFRVVDEGGDASAWTPLKVTVAKPRTVVTNGIWELTFELGKPLPINSLACPGGPSLGHFHWPKGVKPTGVTDEWVEQGPARSILKRTFRFADDSRRYTLTLTFRAGDPWIGVTDEYALGEGTAIRLDLRAMKPDKVYHHYAYNARTFRPGGESEDSTLQPPQHPIATLGPIWRDIWYNGGPFAFVYRTGANCGLGLATVRGSRWSAPGGVSLESQNLFIHGDKETPGQVEVEIPTNFGTANEPAKRHWALIVGDPGLRTAIPGMIRSHADVPLDTILRDWVLDWKSDSPAARGVGTYGYLHGPFNQHQKCPTTIPRQVKKMIRGLGGGPFKSRELAALAYIFCNPDYWPGPDSGWAIGNPNFHTDMYPVPFLIALRMPDHPHADRWLDHGIRNIKGQVYGDSFPGGSWKESLGYSGAFFAITEYAASAKGAGEVDPFRDWPRIKEIAIWFACMETPVDPRYGQRQKAPLGDTSPGSHVGRLNRLGEHFRGVDHAFAEQLARFPQKWEGALDISSRAFPGFGAALRGNAYDEQHESYVTIKAGPARNHYQGDELSFYFASESTPLAIDYACHYSPRPWHAAMHNRPDMDDLRPVAIGCPRAIATSETADVFVADERTRDMSQVPLEPHNTHRPGWEYPTQMLPEATPWTFRRYAMLVKHDPTTSKIPDYLVLRDEIDSPKPVWWNLHVLGREIDVDGQTVRFCGQLGVDLTAHFLTPRLGDVQKRQWGWRNMDANVRRSLKGEEYEKAMFGNYVPKDFERGAWGRSGTPKSKDPADFTRTGEMGKWLRVKGDAGRTDWLVVLMPNRKGTEPARVERLSSTSARITLGDESETIHLGSDAEHQAGVVRNGKSTVLLKKGQVKPWSEQTFTPIPNDIDQGAR